MLPEGRRRAEHELEHGLRPHKAGPDAATVQWVQEKYGRLGLSGAALLGACDPQHRVRVQGLRLGVALLQGGNRHP